MEAFLSVDDDSSHATVCITGSQISIKIIKCNKKKGEIEGNNKRRIGHLEKQ